MLANLQYNSSFAVAVEELNSEVDFSSDIVIDDGTCTILPISELCSAVTVDRVCPGADRVSVSSTARKLILGQILCVAGPNALFDAIEAGVHARVRNLKFFSHANAAFLSKIEELIRPDD